MSGGGQMAELLQAVREVAELAGAVALEHYRKGVEAEVKADRTPVTIADRAAEDAARSWLEQRFPQDGIVGEERGVTRPDAQRRWIVDPIDGTRTFLRGVPLWGTLVGVAEGDEVLAGCAAFPALGEWVAAARGEGAWHQGHRCTVSKTALLEHALVLTTDERFTTTPFALPGWRAVSEQVGLTRTWGDCYGYLLVATGRAEMMVDAVLADWDAVALQPVIEEAGGVFTDWKGRRTAFGKSGVATNRALAEPLRKALGIGGGA